MFYIKPWQVHWNGMGCCDFLLSCMEPHIWRNFCETSSLEKCQPPDRSRLASWARVPNDLVKDISLKTNPVNILYIKRWMPSSGSRCELVEVDLEQRRSSTFPSSVDSCSPAPFSGWAGGRWAPGSAPVNRINVSMAQCLNVSMAHTKKWMI